MIKINTYSEQHNTTANELQEVTDFLYENLDEFGDPKADIEKAMLYAMGKDQKPGGLVITAIDGDTDKVYGAVVINRTGMSGYIPENILVYIATHKNTRGKGIGKILMQKAIEMSEGDIALHCEPENPARFLYEKLGFTSKYLEMRLKK
ncbi:MAG: GNAT family N-acetyltransferase [Kaistella sp.]|jgi:GNAT superfamily N-acetyltransferase|nr:GNAT family N-acetyltransferase [Kaistella sp.]